jgi:hypothetical protein
LKNADEKYEESLAITDRMLQQGRQELGPDDLGTIDFMNHRVEVLGRLGDLAKAGSSAEELVAVRLKKRGPDDAMTLRELASLADIRHHQGATAEATKLFVRLRDGAQRAPDASKSKNPGSVTNYDLEGELVWAERLARTLGQPDRSSRSQFSPGVSGGPPWIDAPLQQRSPVLDGRIEPDEYGDGNGFSFDFSSGSNLGGSYLCGNETLPPDNVKDVSDLSPQMHAVHTTEALFLAFRVRDQSVIADPNKLTWGNDCIEVYLDGDGMANDWTLATHRINREGFIAAADVLGRPVGPRQKARTVRTKDGYIVEFEFPLETIDTLDGPGFKPPATDSELRMNVAILDYDEGNTQPAYGVLWCDDSRWSLNQGDEDFCAVALRLTPAPAQAGLTTRLPAEAFAPP